jgi:hypothetical protein
MEIIELTKSPKDNKRYRIVLEDEDGKQKHWDFGAEGGSTFIDHADPKKRYNYLRRHLANPTERARIWGGVPSPALFSAVLLWGQTSDLTKQIITLQKILNASDSGDFFKYGYYKH